MKTVDNLVYNLVFDRPSAIEALAHIRSEEHWALDFETTSLSPADGKVRLTAVSNGTTNYLFDHDNCGSFVELAKEFVGPTYAVFYAGFELRWFQAAGAREVTLWDVGLMKAAKMGGGPRSLAVMVKQDLDIDLEKGLQTSDWGTYLLTEQQLAYGMYDAYVTWLLHDKWWNGELDEGQQAGFHVLNDTWSAIIELETVGFQLDCNIHMRNIQRWKRKLGVAERYFRKWTPVSIIANMNSNKQVSDFLKRELSQDALEHWPTTSGRGYLQLDRDTLTQAAYGIPYPMNRWLAAFINYRKWAKYLSTYGETLVTKQHLSGKLTSRYNIAGAKTGRMSSANINGQNIPRKPYIRKAFIAPPLSGDTMTLADYSGIEVRVLAEVSGDAQLLHDAIYGDVHMSAAAVINEIDEATYRAVLADNTSHDYYKLKELRNKAKVFNFRLLYGAGIGSLAISLKKTHLETEAALKAWATRYPKAYHYRQHIFDKMNFDGFIPVVDGRTIYVRRSDRTMPVAANYPIQGAAASVMYRACHHVHRLLYERDIDAVMCGVIHDELLCYAGRSVASEAMAAQIEGMTQGWLDIFPGTNTDNLLDYAIGDSWAEKP